MLDNNRCRRLAEEMEREAVLLNDRNRTEHLFLAAELRQLAERRAVTAEHRAA